MMDLVFQMIDFRIFYYLDAGDILAAGLFLLLNNDRVECRECKTVFALIRQATEIANHWEQICYIRFHVMAEHGDRVGRLYL